MIAKPSLTLLNNHQQNDVLSFQFYVQVFTSIP